MRSEDKKKDYANLKGQKLIKLNVIMSIPFNSSPYNYNLSQPHISLLPIPPSNYRSHPNPTICNLSFSSISASSSSCFSFSTRILAIQVIKKGKQSSISHVGAYR